MDNPEILATRHWTKTSKTFILEKKTNEQTTKTQTYKQKTN